MGWFARRPMTKSSEVAILWCAGRPAIWRTLPRWKGKGGGASEALGTGTNPGRGPRQRVGWPTSAAWAGTRAAKSQWCADAAREVGVASVWTVGRKSRERGGGGEGGGPPILYHVSGCRGPHRGGCENRGGLDRRTMAGALAPDLLEGTRAGHARKISLGPTRGPGRLNG